MLLGGRRISAGAGAATAADRRRDPGLPAEAGSRRASNGTLLNIKLRARSACLGAGEGGPLRHLAALIRNLLPARRHARPVQRDRTPAVGCGRFAQAHPSHAVSGPSIRPSWLENSAYCNHQHRPGPAGRHHRRAPYIVSEKPRSTAIIFRSPSDLLAPRRAGIRTLVFFNGLARFAVCGVRIRSPSERAGAALHP